MYEGFLVVFNLEIRADSVDEMRNWLPDVPSLNLPDCSTFCVNRSNNFMPFFYHAYKIVVYKAENKGFLAFIIL